MRAKKNKEQRVKSKETTVQEQLQAASSKLKAVTIHGIVKGHREPNHFNASGGGGRGILRFSAG